MGRMDNRPLNQIELEADCLAGVWSGHVGEIGGRVRLEPGDLLVGAAQLFLAGDYAVDNPGHHGTPRSVVTPSTVGCKTGSTGASAADRRVSWDKRNGR